LNVTELKPGNGRAANIIPSTALGDVRYEIRGQPANRACELVQPGGRLYQSRQCAIDRIDDILVQHA